MSSRRTLLFRRKQCIPTYTFRLQKDAESCPLHYRRPREARASDHEIGRGCFAFPSVDVICIDMEQRRSRRSDSMVDTQVIMGDVQQLDVAVGDGDCRSHVPFFCSLRSWTSIGQKRIKRALGCIDTTLGEHFDPCAVLYGQKCPKLRSKQNSFCNSATCDRGRRHKVLYKICRAGGLLYIAQSGHIHGQTYNVYSAL